VELQLVTPDGAVVDFRDAERRMPALALAKRVAISCRSSAFSWWSSASAR
jgi:hypothetical protein